MFVKVVVAYWKVEEEADQLYRRPQMMGQAREGEDLCSWFLNCDPSGRNQSHVGRVRFPLRAEMHGRAHITDSCFIAFRTSKIC